ncbi:MAG: hypothetical protein ACKO8Y_01460, partial [Actinomycetota bacterium]
MSEVDPLIKRELQWMALGVLENRDLTTMVFARVKRRRIRRVLISLLTIASLLGISVAGYALMSRESAPQEIAIDTGATGSTDDDAIDTEALLGL